MHYVVGLLFDTSGSAVALIEKKKGPAALIGTWNGIGGKIEQYEHPDIATSREFEEETGVKTDPSAWNKFLELSGTDWKVYFYFCRNTYALDSVITREEENIEVFELEDLPRNLAPNLRWIIPMALNHTKDHVKVYSVFESEVC